MLQRRSAATRDVKILSPFCLLLWTELKNFISQRASTEEYSIQIEKPNGNWADFRDSSKQARRLMTKQFKTRNDSLVNGKFYLSFKRNNSIETVTFYADGTFLCIAHSGECFLLTFIWPILLLICLQGMCQYFDSVAAVHEKCFYSPKSFCLSFLHTQLRTCSGCAKLCLFNSIALFVSEAGDPSQRRIYAWEELHPELEIMFCIAGLSHFNLNLFFPIHSWICIYSIWWNWL